MHDANALVRPSLQEDGTVDLLAEFENGHGEGESCLTEDQRKLLEEIVKEFSPQDNAADLGILFEVTGFQADAEGDQFWQNYQDYEDLV